MSSRQVIFIIAAYVLMTIIEAFVGGLSPDGSVIGRVVTTGIIRVQTVDVLLLPAFDVPLPNTEFIGAFLTIVTLDFTYFHGPLALVRLMIGLPLWGASAYGLAVTIGPMLIAAGGVLVRFIRG